MVDSVEGRTGSRAWGPCGVALVGWGLRRQMRLQARSCRVGWLGRFVRWWLGCLLGWRLTAKFEVALGLELGLVWTGPRSIRR